MVDRRIIVLLADAVNLFTGLRDILQANEWSIHSHQVIEQVESLIPSIKEAQAAQEEYLLTGDGFLKLFNEDSGAASRVVAELRESTADNPRQQTRLDTLLARMNQNSAQMSKMVELRKMSDSIVRADAAAYGRSGAGLMAEIAAPAEAMKREELALLEQRAQRNESVAHTTIVMLVTGTSALFALLVAGAFMIHRKTAGLVREAASAAQGREAYRLLAVRLQTIREEERVIIAREIHDELGQQVTALKADLAGVEQCMLRGDMAGGVARLRSATSGADATIQSMRRIATELRPPLLDFLGIVPAIEAHAELFEKRHGIRVRVETPATDLNLSSDVNVALFRIVQESLTNVARYSKATEAVVVIESRESVLRVTVRDNGIGFQRNLNTGNSLGQLGMQERARSIGASLILESNPNEGTSVSVHLPLSPPEALLRMTHRILLIDDHPAVLRGVRDILCDRRTDLEFESAVTADEAVTRVRTSHWDMAIVDLSLPGSIGFNLIRALKDEQPLLRILVYTMHPEEQLGVRALQAGADGFLSKGVAADEVARAVSRILDGRRYMSDALETMMAVKQPAARDLSEREYQVLERIGRGRGLSEIAGELGLSVKTVGTYRTRILEKLSLETTADLVRYAVDNGIIT